MISHFPLLIKTSTGWRVVDIFFIDLCFYWFIDCTTILFSVTTASHMCGIIWCECTHAWRRPHCVRPSVPLSICLASSRLAYYPPSDRSVWCCIWALPPMIQKHSTRDWACSWDSDFWPAIRLGHCWIWWSPLSHPSLLPHWLARPSCSFRSVARHCWPNVAVSCFWVASSWASSAQWHCSVWPTSSSNRKWSIR